MYILTKDGQFVKFLFSLAEINKSLPEVSLPEQLNEEILAQYGIFKAEQTVPLAKPYQKVVRENPIFVNNKWIDNLQLVDLVGEELENTKKIVESNVKTDRNKRLTESDWTQLSDVVVDKAAWIKYRQDLRDVTNQPNFPWEVSWPTKPV